MPEQPKPIHKLIREHDELTRRCFVQLGAAVAAAGLASAAEQRSAELETLLRELEYLTRQEDFGTVERGEPLPYTLPPDKLKAAGLTQQSWRLEVVPDPDSDAKVDNPLSQSRGNALDWNGLMNLAQTRAVRFLKVMTCNNGGRPLGMGLWEGVPLRDVIWMAKPVENIRRVFYHGYHNEDPAQLFRSSLPIGRVLEDPPGEHPVTLCYKLNGQWLSGKRGGPVRMLAPDAYGFKSIKWLTRVTLTNRPFANDTYAEKNNDIDSKMKTFARFIHAPQKAEAGQAIPVTGIAQSGMSGLSKVQVCLVSRGQDWPADDPYFDTAGWKDAEILPAPDDWGGGLPGGKLPTGTRLIDAATGKPREWPLRYATVHWALLLAAPKTGKYYLKCRTIDANGVAQPMPRPFAKSGKNAIESVPLTVGVG